MTKAPIYTFRHAVQEWLTYPTAHDGRQSDDHGWSYQSLTYQLLQQRSVVIDTLKGERGAVSDAMRQVIRCVPMERVDRVECPCAPPSGCFWAKSITPIPTPSILNYVSDVRGEATFIPTKWEHAHRIKKGRIESKKSKRHYLLREDGYGQTNLYVILPLPLEGQALHIPAFTLAGVFMNPIEVAQYPDCDGKQSKAICNPLDVPFYTDILMRSMIFDSLNERILRARVRHLLM